MAAAATAGSPPSKWRRASGAMGAVVFAVPPPGRASWRRCSPTTATTASPLRAACGRDPVGRVLRASPCHALPGAGCLQWPWGGCVEVPGPKLPLLPYREWWLLPPKVVVELLVVTGGCPPVCATLCGALVGHVVAALTCGNKGTDVAENVVRTLVSPA